MGVCWCQVKFIKFFAWEEQWINRALDAREHEMKWMVKGALAPFVLFICVLHSNAAVDSADELGDVLPLVDSLPYSRRCGRLLHVRDAGE